MPLPATLFITRPSTHPPLRRRDPFGFADAASYYAELLAPDLTNRQRDARWLSILCWSLEQVERAFPELENNQDRYDRLRGLELRWVIQACQLAKPGDGRQLPGSREIRKISKAAEFRLLRNKMSDDQWRRYRYVGPYAAYRGLLQSLGLVAADGWRLTQCGKRLAAVTAQKAGLTLRATNIRRTGKRADEESGWVGYWLRRWHLPVEKVRANAFLPTNGEALSSSEQKILAPVLFDSGGIRLRVAESIGRSSAKTHASLCRQLQDDLRGWGNWSLGDKSKLAKLGDFAILADTAVEALTIAFDLVVSHSSAAPELADIARGMATQLKQLETVCATWKPDGQWPGVDHFASAIRGEKSPLKLLHRLVLFHERQASGLVWLRIRNGKLDREVRYNHAPGGYYRFRLDALGRLALGCGVIGGRPPCFGTAETDVDALDDPTEI
jgi:hypothetical protein